MDLTDIAEQDKADRALDESRGSPQPTPVTEDLVAEQVIRAVPDPDGQPQLPGLRAQALETPAPQQELGLEGGSEGITPTTTGGTAPPPPPIPRTASRETKNATQALAAVGRSRSIAGEPIKVDIAEDHSAISVDGRTFKNRSRDAMNRFRKIPNWARVYIDLASTIRITGPRVAEEIYRSLQSDTRALGQAVTNHNKRFEAAFRISTGKKFSKATREESRLMHRYMNGEVELSTLRDELGANKDLIKVLDDMRADIKSLGMAFLDEGIIASEMRATVQENLGTYLHATYAANVLNTPGTNLDTLLSKIPQEHQDQWVAAFLQVHRSPIEDGTLGTLDISTLRRMIKTLGLTGRRSTIDSKTGESVDEVYLIDHPQQKSINSASKEDMMEILSRHHVPEDVKSDTIINTLKTGAGATSLPTLSGVDSSIQRKRSLARNEKDLREAGYTEAEIKLNQATRELLMEVVNPITSTGITMRKMMDYITAHRFINNIALLKDSGLVAIGKAEGDLNTQLIPADHPMGRIRIPDPSREGGYTQAGPTSEVSKDGLYVHPEVASMVQHLLGISSVPSMPSFVRFVAVLGKINLTAGASRTHVRNTVTAGQLALSHGHLMDAPSKTVPGMKIAKGAALRDLGRGKLSNKTGKRELQDDLDDILEYTTSLDIWNNSLGVGAVKEIMVRELSKKDASDAFGTNTYVGLDGSTAEQLLSKYTGKALAKPLQLYRLEDEAVKVYAFIVERQRYAKLTGREDILEVIEGRVPNPTDEQLEAVRIFDRGVANYITSVYPTYSRVFRWGRALSRNLIVTDFPSFNLEMFRNSTNDYIDMIQLATGEGRYEGVDKAKRIPVLGQRIAAKLLFHGTNLKSLAAVSIPLLMASGDYSEEDDPVFNPIGVGATLKDRQRAQRASQRASNGQPFSKQALEPVIAEMGGTWYKYAQIKIHDFVPGEYVDVEVLDFSIAGGQQTVMAVNAAAAIEMLVAHGDIEGASEAVLAGLEAAMYDYIKFSVAVKTSEEIISGTRESGGHIWEEDDSPSEKLKKSALHIYKVMIPTGSLVREGMRLKDASDEGRLSDEALNHAIGRSKKRNRIDGWLVSNLKRLENDSQGFAAAEKRINRLVSSSDNMTDAEFINKYTDLAERRRNGYDSIRNVINNARALGMSDVRIEDKLKAEKLASKGGMKPVDFMDDYYSPYQRTFKEAFTRFKPRKRSKLSPLEIEIAGESMIATIEHRLDLIQSVQDAAGE